MIWIQNILAAIYGKTAIKNEKDILQVEIMALNSELMTKKYDNVYLFLFDATHFICCAENLSKETLTKLVVNVQKSYSMINEDLNQAIKSVTMRFIRQIIRFRKMDDGITHETKHNRIYLKGEENEDLLEQFFKVSNCVYFEDNDTLNQMLKVDSKLANFYETNKEKLNGIGKGSRVMDFTNHYMSLPLDFKQNIKLKNSLLPNCTKAD